MIERYTRPEMGVIWSLENRFGKMLQVEIAVAKVQAEMKIIPRRAADDSTEIKIFCSANS